MATYEQIDAIIGQWIRDGRIQAAWLDIPAAKAKIESLANDQARLDGLWQSESEMVKRSENQPLLYR